MLSDVVDSAVETVETWEAVRPRGLPEVLVVSPAMDSVSDWRGVVGVRPPGPFEFGGTSWTWRFRGWLDFAGGGRTNMNVFIFYFSGQIRESLVRKWPGSVGIHRERELRAKEKKRAEKFDMISIKT